MFSPLPYSVLPEVLASETRQGKDIKGLQIEKVEVKLSFFTDNMIIYVENLIESTKATRTSAFSKVSGYMIAIKTHNFIFLHQRQSEIERKIPFKITKKYAIPRDKSDKRHIRPIH